MKKVATWLMDFTGDIWQVYVEPDLLAHWLEGGEVRLASDAEIIRERLWLVATDPAVHDAYHLLQAQRVGHTLRLDYINALKDQYGMTEDIEAMCRHCMWDDPCKGVEVCYPQVYGVEPQTLRELDDYRNAAADKIADARLAYNHPDTDLEVSHG